MSTLKDNINKYIELVLSRVFAFPDDGSDIVVKASRGIVHIQFTTANFGEQEIFLEVGKNDRLEIAGEKADYLETMKYFVIVGCMERMERQSNDLAPKVAQLEIENASLRSTIARLNGETK
jgi:hypothetical protein